MPFRKTLLTALAVLPGLLSAQDIPEGFQAQILSYAPQVDTNNDQVISKEELMTAYVSLPKRVQKVVRNSVPELFEEGAGEEGKPTTDTADWKFSRPAVDPADARTKGFNCLFLGHSYFVPIVSQIPSHAQALGLNEHEQFLIAAGGPRGSPGFLWNDEAKRNKARALIEQGDVELLAMTAHNVGSDIEDYSRWIDLALEHNPKTVFVIQTPWAQKQDKTFEQYSADIEEGTQKTSILISGLRGKYPGTEIVNVPQNKWMLELWKLKNNGKLPEITEVIAPKRNLSQEALFSDRHGHGGRLAVQEGVFMWLPVIYGIDLESYEVATLTEFDTKALAQKIIESDPYTTVPN